MRTHKCHQGVFLVSVPTKAFAVANSLRLVSPDRLPAGPPVEGPWAGAALFSSDATSVGTWSDALTGKTVVLLRRMSVLLSICRSKELPSLFLTDLTSHPIGRVVRRGHDD